MDHGEDDEGNVEVENEIEHEDEKGRTGEDHGGVTIMNQWIEMCHPIMLLLNDWYQ